MELQNNWVGYLDRSAEQIKQAVKNRIISVLPELYDDSDNNPQNIIIDIFAGLTEMLNYYIDSFSRESFIGTAQMYKSMVNLTRILDYRIKANYPPTVDLLFSINQETNIDIIIPKNTAVTNGSYNYLTDKDVVIPAGSTEVTVSASQRITKYMQYIGTTDGATNKNQILAIPSDYIQGSGQITISSELYNLVDSFYNQGPDDRSFIVDVNENKELYVKLGDGLNGKKPTANESIYLTYEATNGSVAFATANTLTTILSTISTPDDVTLSVTNLKNSTMGVGIEDIESIRRNAPLTVRTLNVGVTKSDIEVLARGFGDIKHAYLSQGCGKEHYLYVSPEQPDNATYNTLTDKQKADLELYINQRIVFSNTVYVKKLQLAKIKLSVDVYLDYIGNSSGGLQNTTSSIYNAIISTLTSKYGYSSARINSSIFISDIIYCIDDQEGVNHNSNLHITMDPIYMEDSEELPNWLTSSFEILTSNQAYDYILYKTSQTSILVKNKTNGSEIPLTQDGETDVYYNDGIIKFTWPMLSEFDYEPSRYQFRVYPNDSNIIITDSIALPIILASNLTYTDIRLHKQLANGNWE